MGRIDAVLLPGLVNAHAHLDLAHGEALPATGDFTEWLSGVGARRAGSSDVASAAEVQARMLAARGVVAVGDIDGSGGRGLEGRRRSGLAGCTYLEVVGVSAKRGRERLRRALAHLPRSDGELGLAPHAPYSVHEDVLKRAIRACKRRGLPLAMHVAETEEETRYLLAGDGPFRAFLDGVGQGPPFRRPPGVRPVEYVARAGFFEAGGVIVHGNDLDHGDVERLAHARASVVYCHATHRHFARPPHRFVELAGAGVNMALGTDSSASTSSVDLFADMTSLARDRPDVDPQLILVAATRGGRLALRREVEAASFEPGSRADALLLAPAPDAVEDMHARDLAAWVVSGDARIALTFHAGVMHEPEEGVPAVVQGQLDTLSAQG